MSTKKQNGKVTVGDLPPLMVKLEDFSGMFKEEEIRDILGESGSPKKDEIDFEGFLRVGCYDASSALSQMILFLY